MASTAFAALLERLGVERGDVVFVHSSYARVRQFGSASDLVDGLLDRVGPAGTVVLPSFTWNIDPTARPWKGYADYLRTRPTFDVRTTPTNLGFVAETFRRWPGVRRSASYCWSVAALGPLAETICTEQVHVVHPFGPSSAFNRLHALGAKVIGLGVTLNTSSLAPLVDYALGPEHPHAVFTEEPIEGIVIDEQGRSVATRTYTLQPDVVRLIKPSRMLEPPATLAAAVRRADEGETIYFGYPYDAYHQAGLAAGRQAILSGGPVPWLAAYPLRAAHPVGQ